MFKYSPWSARISGIMVGVAVREGGAVSDNPMKTVAIRDASTDKTLEAKTGILGDLTLVLKRFRRGEETETEKKAEDLKVRGQDTEVISERAEKIIKEYKKAAAFALTIMMGINVSVSALVALGTGNIEVGLIFAGGTGALIAGCGVLLFGLLVPQTAKFVRWEDKLPVGTIIHMEHGGLVYWAEKPTAAE
jgi:hypothetical protein